MLVRSYPPIPFLYGENRTAIYTLNFRFTLWKIDLEAKKTNQRLKIRFIGGLYDHLVQGLLCLPRSTLVEQFSGIYTTRHTQAGLGPPPAPLHARTRPSACHARRTSGVTYSLHGARSDHWFAVSGPNGPRLGRGWLYAGPETPARRGGLWPQRPRGGNG